MPIRLQFLLLRRTFSAPRTGFLVVLEREKRKRQSRSREDAHLAVLLHPRFARLGQPPGKFWKSCSNRAGDLVLRSQCRTERFLYRCTRDASALYLPASCKPWDSSQQRFDSRSASRGLCGKIFDHNHIRPVPPYQVFNQFHASYVPTMIGRLESPINQRFSRFKNHETESFVVRVDR